MRLNGAPVLVTGAGGFIGSHLAEALVRAGATTRALVHYDARGDWGHLASLPNDVLRDIERLAGFTVDAFAELVRATDGGAAPRIVPVTSGRPRRNRNRKERHA